MKTILLTVIITLVLYTTMLTTGIMQLVALGDMTGAFGRTFNIAEDDKRLTGYFAFRKTIGGNLGGIIK